MTLAAKNVPIEVLYASFSLSATAPVQSRISNMQDAVSFYIEHLQSRVVSDMRDAVGGWLDLASDPEENGTLRQQGIHAVIQTIQALGGAIQCNNGEDARIGIQNDFREYTYGLGAKLSAVAPCAETTLGRLLSIAESRNDASIVRETAHRAYGILVRVFSAINGYAEKEDHVARSSVLAEEFPVKTGVHNAGYRPGNF